MAYYSFIVKSPGPLGMTNPLVALDEGINTFTALLEGPEDVPVLEDFLKRLRNEGVEILQTNRLDQHEPGSPEDLLLPHEPRDKLLE